jgi:hypothetical protein
MKECDNIKIHISSNFILSISLLIMFDILLLRPSLYCNTPLHFTTLHHTSPNYTSLHFTLYHTLLNYTSLHFTLYRTLPKYTSLHFVTLYTLPNYTLLHFVTLHASPHFTQLHFTTLVNTSLLLIYTLLPSHLALRIYIIQ